MEYLAHISDDKTRKQTVLEHSQNVAMLAKQYADVFEAGSWGYCCGETHDMTSFDFFHTGTVINSTMITAAAIFIFKNHG